MKLIDSLKRVIMRLRYPVSMPEDIADALGISLPNSLTFKEFVQQVTKPCSLPTRLAKYMPRELAEKAFWNAVCKERFCEKTLICYYFTEGWVEFMLQFDKDSRLRRIYIMHREIQADRGIEIPLNTDSTK